MTTKKKSLSSKFLLRLLAIMLWLGPIDGFFPFGTKSLMAVDFKLSILAYMPISNICF